jgi:hypothetical protein
MDPDVAARLVGRRTGAPVGRRAAWPSRSWTRPRGAHGVLHDWRALLWTAAHRLTCLHPESRQPYVISEHALCFARNECPSVGAVTQ